MRPRPPGRRSAAGPPAVRSATAGPGAPPPPPRHPPRGPARCPAPAPPRRTASAGTTTRRTPRAREGDAHRQDARHPANLAAEPELPDQGHAARGGAHLLRPEQDPERDREVQRRPRLAQLCRREVHGDPPRRVVEAGVPEGAADALPRLRQRGVREADDREPGQPRRDVDLDADDASGDPLERCGEEGCEHGRHGRPCRLPARLSATRGQVRDAGTPDAGAGRLPPSRSTGSTWASAPCSAPAGRGSARSTCRSPSRSPAPTVRARSPPWRP